VKNMKVLISILGAAAPALAQCSMCRTAAAAQGPSAMHAMNMAVLLLLLPALALFSGMFVLAFWYARRTSGGESAPPWNRS
jgi:hypothetical protein